MPALTISFPQTLSLLKGANYSNRVIFTPFKWTTLQAGVQFQPIPLASNYLPDGYSSTSNTYPSATSSTTYNSALTFKYGGRLIDTEVGLFSPNKPQVVSVLNGGPRYTFGDFHALMSSPGISNSADFYLNASKYFVHETRAEETQSRSALIYTPLSGLGSNEGTYMPSVSGYYTLQTSGVMNKIHFYWKGNVQPLPAKSTSNVDNNSVITDYRIFVGVGRDHSNIITTYHPQSGSGGTPRPAGFDQTCAVFMAFDDVLDQNKPKWWALIRTTDPATAQQDIFISAPTNLSIYATNELEIIVSDTNIIWKANGTTVLTHTINNSLYAYEVNNELLGSSIRCLKYQLSGQTILPNCTANMITQALTIRREISLATPLVDIELGLQNTGLQLLKKLK